MVTRSSELEWSSSLSASGLAQAASPRTDANERRVPARLRAQLFRLGNRLVAMHKRSSAAGGGGTEGDKIIDSDGGEEGIASRSAAVRAPAFGDAASAEGDDWPEFRIESSALVPALVLPGLVAIAARGIWSILSTPGAPVGDDLSSHFAEITFFARSLRAGDLNLWFTDAQLGSWAHPASHADLIAVDRAPV